MFLRRRCGEQGGSRRDETIGRARDFHRADDLRYAGINELEPLADLPKCVDARARGQNGEAADAEECEQQPRAQAELEIIDQASLRLFRKARSAMSLQSMIDARNCS